jgi:aryl-alcohol dehydrogenase-like predicted oxidoreductase
MSNRRDFLKTGLLAGGALAATQALGKVPEPFKSKNETTNSNFTGAIKQRYLGTGKNRIEVSAVGLGCMGMTFNRSFIPEKKPMIAKKITLCSKFGFDIQNGKLTGALNSKPEHIRQVVEESLKRLNTDVIDLLYQHRVDPKVPMEDVAGNVKDLINEGKVKHFGLSEAGVESIRKAHAVQPLTALQTEFSLMTREPAAEVLPVCEELGIGFVPYSPLCRAYLTGYINERTKYVAGNDNRPTLPRYKPENIIANWAIIDVLVAFGNQNGYTAAQLALAWLQAQKPWIVPIPGTTKLAHLQENIGSTDIVLSEADLKELTDKITAIPISGDRYATPQTK